MKRNMIFKTVFSSMYNEQMKTVVFVGLEWSLYFYNVLFIYSCTLRTSSYHCRITLQQINLMDFVLIREHTGV